MQQCSVDYTVTDGNGLTATNTITWTVLPTSLVANPEDPMTVTEGNSVVFDLLANDVDPEGTGPITITLVDGQDITAGPVTTADGIVITLNANGTITAMAPLGTPAGSYVITYGIVDGDPDSAMSTFEVVVEELVLPVGLIDSTDADGSGIATITTTGTDGDGSAFDADDKGQLIIRTKTDGNVILDTGMVSNGTTGDIEFPVGTTIGTYEVGGVTTFDTTAILYGLGLCCFDAEYTACNQDTLSATVVTTDFQGSKIYDLTTVFGDSAGLQTGQLNSQPSAGSMQWVSSGQNNPSSGSFGGGFNYVLGGRLAQGVATTDPFLDVTFATPVKNLVFEVNDVDEDVTYIDEATLTADLAGVPVSLDAIVSVGTQTVAGSPGQSVVITGASGLNAPAVDNVVSVTVASPVDHVHFDSDDVLGNPTSTGSFGYGVKFVSAECCDPACN